MERLPDSTRTESSHITKPVRSQRGETQWLAALAIALLAVVICAWLWTRRTPPVVELAPATPTTVAAPTEPPAPTEEPIVEVRLAGTAILANEASAIIEFPDGTSGFFQVGDQVSDVGTIAQIRDGLVVLTSSDGDVTLRVQPAATGTPDRRRVKGQPTAAETTPSSPR